MDAEPFDPALLELLGGFADFVWQLRADGTLGSLRAIGSAVPAEDRAGRSWLDAVEPADRYLAERLWEEARDGARVLDTVLRLRLAAGEVVPVHLRLVPLRTPGGEAAGWRGIGRRLAGGEEGAEAYRRVIETIDDGFATLEILYRPDGSPFDCRFLTVNAAFQRQTGFGDARGRTALELVPGLPQQWFDIYDRIARSGRAERFVEVQEAPDRLYEVYAPPLGEPGGSRLAVLFRDILPRRRAEQQLLVSERRLATLVRGMPQLVWRASDAGRWTWTSPQWTAHTGQAEADSHGFGWLKAVHPDDRALVVKAWERASERGEFQAEIRIGHVRERSERWFNVRAVPVRDEEGAAFEWIGTCTDVDEMHQLQGRQELLLAELQHRTRNLLTVVTSVAERTARAARSVEDFLPRFRERLAALSRINGLLSQLDRGQRVTFGDLIRAELQTRGVLDPEGAGRVVLDGPDGVRLRSASVQTFALAIHELATNAVKYGALAGDAGRLAVRWRLHEPEAGRRRLCVEWTESGVAARAPAATPGGGYGRELIERALPYQLKAQTRYEIGADGVRCTIDLPVD